jgi:toxin ParE1/3/4
MKPVVIHHDADDDLDEAIAYYEKQKRGLGLDLETEVRQAIGRIRQEPQRGSQ